MNAAADFALCGRTPKSCSRHADCARAQFGSRNPQRQTFAWPADTGERCPIFHDFAPYRKLAAMGGGIADQLSAGPISGKLVTGSGGPGVARDTGRNAVPAGEDSPAGLDTTQEFGVNEVRVAGGVMRSTAAGNPEITQQLHAARLLRL